MTICSSEKKLFIRFNAGVFPDRLCSFVSVSFPVGFEGGMY